jgi:ketosteroid isomerase-like protein
VKTRSLVVMISCFAALILFSALATPTWATPAPDTASQSQALQQSLVAAQQALFEAIKKKDVDYCKKAVADDVVLVTTTGETAGKDELVEAARNGALPAQPRMYNVQAVPVNNNAAILTYDVVVEGKPRYQHISTTWVKQGEQWKLKFQQSTPNLFSLGDE